MHSNPRACAVDSCALQPCLSPRVYGAEFVLYSLIQIRMFRKTKSEVKRLRKHTNTNTHAHTQTHTDIHTFT